MESSSMAGNIVPRCTSQQLAVARTFAIGLSSSTVSWSLDEAPSAKNLWTIGECMQTMHIAEAFELFEKSNSDCSALVATASKYLLPVHDVSRKLAL